MTTQRCVKCGAIVEADRVEDLQIMALPACCPDDEWEVAREVIYDHSMWPSDWYGHAIKTSGDWNWEYTE